MTPMGCLAGTDAYALHQAGRPILIEGDRAGRVPLGAWSRDRLDGDEGLLDRCAGPTLDVGCGPGRLAAALLGRGRLALGIDVSPVAVHLARQRGAVALVRDVYDRVPGEGRWSHVLLADGNIGIGGDPVALLRRCVELLHRGGSVLLDLQGERVGVQTDRVRWRCGTDCGPWFRWSRVGVTAVDAVATAAGLEVAAIWRAGQRWQAHLVRTGAWR